MSVRFRDGKRSNKWDDKAENETLDELEVLKRNIITLNGNVETNKVDIQRITDNINDVQYIINIILILLNSRFVKTINSIGCWFIYGANGCIYRNIPKNEKFGKAPLLTRIIRWFKNYFQDIKKYCR